MSLITKGLCAAGGGLLVMLVFCAGIVIGCSPARGDGSNHYDDQSLDKVAVQQIHDPRYDGGGHTCLVFTHDTAQGASMSVVC